METILITNDNKDRKISQYAIGGVGHLLLTIPEINAADVLYIFSNKEITKHMAIKRNDEIIGDFTGYTVLENIEIQSKYVRIALRKE